MLIFGGVTKITFAKCGFSILYKASCQSQINLNFDFWRVEAWIHLLETPKTGHDSLHFGGSACQFPRLRSGTSHLFYGSSIVHPCKVEQITSYKWGYITLANHLVSAIYCGKITSIVLTCYNSTYNWIVWGPPILGASFISQKAPFGKGEGHEDFLWMATVPFFAYLHLGGCCENFMKMWHSNQQCFKILVKIHKLLVGLVTESLHNLWNNEYSRVFFTTLV